MAESEQGQPSAVALAPAAIEAAVEATAVKKAALPAAKAFVLAMFAGAFIAFGGLYFMVFISDPNLSWGVQRLAGGICFCLGLVLVLCCGAELFTGNSLMACGVASGKVGAGRVLRAWAIVWLGNFAGSLLVVALVYLSGIYKLNGEAVAHTMVSVAAGKVGLSAAEMFFRGILCNLFVCLAVWIGFASKTVTDKVVGILLPISGFVACGFEHAVANMFFLPMGALMHASGYGADAAGAALLAAPGIALNLATVTLGNILGGAVLVGLGYWFAYGRKAV
ncbi:MAG: formate/nitrite transporter family protein [Coriobacteriaceae bacterium]|nr:formate/nitrite transporter family protein [Coriobacteriaceae bacterium]